MSLADVMGLTSFATDVDGMLAYWDGDRLSARPGSEGQRTASRTRSRASLGLSGGLS
jgi:hypothetical protein